MIYFHGNRFHQKRKMNTYGLKLYKHMASPLEFELLLETLLQKNICMYYIRLKNQNIEVLIASTRAPDIETAKLLNLLY